MGACNKKTDEAPVTKEDLTPPVVDPKKSTVLPEPTTIPPVLVVVPKPAEITPMVVKASLQSPKQTQTDSHNTALPPVFYAIIGRGPAAAIDHTTLLQADFGRKRMNESPAGPIPVLHVGFSNPWMSFFEHGMGQPSYLLNLPGFHSDNQPGSPSRDAMKDAGLKSVVFGACVDEELDRCLREERYRWRDKSTTAFEKAGWPVVNGWVVWVQTTAREPLTHALIEDEIGGPAVKAEVVKKLRDEVYPVFPPGVAPYRLLVLRTEGDHLVPEFIYAQFIDFCTGSGRPRQERTEAEFRTARLEPWRDPASWPGMPAATRKVVVAGEAVRREFDWGSARRACIANGGAIALNAAERARDEENWADWFHNSTLLEAFGNPRNFTFIKSKRGARARTPDEDKPIKEPDLIAADERTRLGRYAQVKSVTVAADCDVKLEAGVPRGQKVAPPTQPPPLIREYSGTELAMVSEMWDCTREYKEGCQKAIGQILPSRKYDYVILHGGLVTDLLGQPDKTGIKVTPKGAPGAGGTAPMVCLATGDNVIRVLGAAAQMYIQQRPDEATDQSRRMWDYRSTLPVSAVFDGFILAGMNIANANAFFQVTPNRNVNTMTADELAEALADRGGFADARDLADKIVAARSVSNGYSSAQDLMAKVTAYAPFQAMAPTTAEAEKTKIRLKHESEVQSLLQMAQSAERDNLIELKKANYQKEMDNWNQHPDGMLGLLQRDDKSRRDHLADRLNSAIQFSYE
jgi:hypothetical protein